MFPSKEDFQAALQADITAWQDRQGVPEDKRVEESPGGFFWTNKYLYAAAGLQETTRLQEHTTTQTKSISTEAGR
eukprot:3105454-Amphidinium_carterae.1